MLDTITITIQSGKGGDGLAAARREAGVPYGGPAGGDGGRGGSVIFRASSNEQTLVNFRKNSILSAKDGNPGMTKDRYGADAEDLVLLIPLGTIVKDAHTHHILYQFTQHDEERIAAQGGRGGVGNIHFKNSINQYPNFALLGEPGEVKELELELQILGDVGLIGTPSVGKSSLINTACRTNVSTAEYHFTTLKPNIGICQMVEHPFSMVDIPGLIEGAAEGKGLGNEFLRHILKAKVFALVTDLDSYEAGFEKLAIVFDEIIQYIHQRFEKSTEFGDEIYNIHLTVQSDTTHIILTAQATQNQESVTLFEKLITLTLNKYDMLNDAEIVDELIKHGADYLCQYRNTQYQRTLQAHDIIKNTSVVSAATHYGIQGWVDKLSRLVQDTDKSDRLFLFDSVSISQAQHDFCVDITQQELPFLLQHGYLEGEHTQLKVREIWDKELSRLVNITPRGNEQAEHWFWKTLRREKYSTKLEKHHVVFGDVLKIMSVYPGTEDRYILYK